MGRKHAQWRQQRRKRVGTGGEATMPATTPAASRHPPAASLQLCPAATLSRQGLVSDPQRARLS
jgi:hypothetical protein